MYNLFLQESYDIYNMINRNKKSLLVILTVLMTVTSLFSWKYGKPTLQLVGKYVPSRNLQEAMKDNDTPKQVIVYDKLIRFEVLSTLALKKCR